MGRYFQSADNERWQRCEKFAWMTPEAWESACRHRETLHDWLIQSCGDPRNGRLLLFAIHCRARPLVQALLKAGASASPQPYGPDIKSYWVPLCFAVKASESPYDPLMVDLLLSHGARFDAPVPVSDITNRSVVASAIDDPVALSDLLVRQLPADMTLNQETGAVPYCNGAETALQYACQGAFDKHTPIRHRRQSTRLLLQAGADLEVPSQFGQTPLMLALVHAPYLVSLLVRSGANLQATDRDGHGMETALSMLASGNPDLAHALARRWSALERAGMEQKTPRLAARARPPAPRL